MAGVNNEKQHITLHIYDTNISVNVPRQDEVSYREAAIYINNKLNSYFATFKGKKSDKEILYYAMIDIALNYVLETKRNDVESIEQVLTKLTSEIESALK